MTKPPVEMRAESYLLVRDSTTHHRPSLSSLTIKLLASDPLVTGDDDVCDPRRLERVSLLTICIK